MPRTVVLKLKWLQTAVQDPDWIKSSTKTPLMRGFLFSDVIIETHRFFTRDMNQDQSELNKFNAVSDSWWDPYGYFRPLHDLNPVRLGWIAAHVSLENKNILDIGCGGGILSESLAREKATVTGIDLAGNALQTARKHCHHSGFPIRYIAISAEDLAKKEAGKYDIVTCMELLEHVPDPCSIVKACSKLIKPGGHVFFATLNRNLKSLFYAIIGAEYIMRLLPKGTHRYEKFITPAELSRYVRSTGMIVTDITGVTCDFRAKKFNLNHNTQVNYMLACTKPE